MEGMISTLSSPKIMFVGPEWVFTGLLLGSHQHTLLVIWDWRNSFGTDGIMSGGNTMLLLQNYDIFVLCRDFC